MVNDPNIQMVMIQETTCRVTADGSLSIEGPKTLVKHVTDTFETKMSWFKDKLASVAQPAFGLDSNQFVNY